MTARSVMRIAGLLTSIVLCVKLAVALAAVDLRENTVQVGADDEFAELPLTVECYVKLEKNDSYNIIIAHHPKSSPRHWELFTLPQSGQFTLYAPGFVPDHIYSETAITDGKFHHIAAVISVESIALFVDGQLKTQQKVTPPDKPGVSAPLLIGSLVEGGIGCAGVVSEVRISRGVRTIVPDVPMVSDDATLALWNFADVADSVCVDRSSHARNAKIASSRDQQLLEAAHITAPFLPLPPLEDIAPLKKSASEIIAALSLKSVRPEDVRDFVWAEWKHDFDNWNRFEYADRRQLLRDNRSPQQVYDRHSLVWNEDGGPTGTALRRTQALLDHLKNTAPASSGVDFVQINAELKRLRAAYDSLKLPPDDSRQLCYYLAVCLVRRRLALANPLLDFDELLCIVRGTYAGSIRSNPSTADVQGGHFVNQYFGFNAIPGGGIYVLSNWKGDGKPEVRDLLANAEVASGRLKGNKLTGGAVCTPDVDFDGQKISFSWSGNRDHQLLYSRDRLWHLFSVNADGTNLTQLSDGDVDDFDSCWLPSGRLAFISERRGGYIRCFSGLIVRQYSLFSMAADGTDAIPLSYYETSEWGPSVDNDGKIVYTRWDYTDRENCLGSRFWTCGPDGSDPRAPHGNYTRPWHTFPDADKTDSRWGAPMVETSFRAIPCSPLYLFTAAPHHGDIDGTICVLDLRIPDDGHMSQIKRVTPDELFPESEWGMRSHFKYKTAFPLSEDFYLANCWENLVLLDRFGNKELLCDLRELPCQHDDRFRVMEPMPLRVRTRPPVIPSKTIQTEDDKKSHADGDTQTATLSVMNVYESDQPLPQGVKIKWLRVVQNILKCTPEMGDPLIGYERENTPRIPLGIVPVEEDGSAYFEAPVAKELIFQILDENKMAVQSMRSVAFVHPGEQLSCTGCHENSQMASGAVRTQPLALRRPPSKLEPELGTIEPISYYRQIKPLFEKHCVECHQQENKAPLDFSYDSLKEDYTFWFSGAMLGGVNTDYSGVHGGTRSIPGRFGARYCKIGLAMLGDTHKNVVPEDAKRTINLWLDCNSLRLTAFHRVEEQLRGELVWPYLDVDPENPLGVEGPEPSLERNFWHQNHEGPHPFLCSSHKESTLLMYDAAGKRVWEYACQNPQDVWMLGNGNILAATLRAVIEIKPDLKSGKGGEVVWEYRTESPNEIPTCQPLSDGNVLIGIVGECRLIEVNRAGNIVKEVKLHTPVQEPHSQFRLCRKTAAGTYLVPFLAEGAMREYNADGTVLRQFPPRPTPVCAIRLPDGNTLVSADKRVTEYSPDGRVVWELTPNDIPDIGIGALAGIRRYANGNTIICNWGATSDGGKIAAHIFELTHDKRIAWLVDSDDFSHSASCQILTHDCKAMPALSQ